MSVLILLQLFYVSLAPIAMANPTREEFDVAVKAGDLSIFQKVNASMWAELMESKEEEPELLADAILDAAVFGHYQMLIKIKEVWPDKVDLTAKLEDGSNILHVAARTGSTKFFEQLKNEKISEFHKNHPLWTTLLAQQEDQGFLPIHEGAYYGHYETLVKMKEVWPDKIDLTAKTEDGNNILHLGAIGYDLPFEDFWRIQDLGLDKNFLIEKNQGGQIGIVSLMHDFFIKKQFFPTTDKDVIELMQAIFEDKNKQNILKDSECFFHLFTLALSFGRVEAARWLLEQAKFKHNVIETMNNNVDFVRQIKAGIVDQFRSLRKKAHLTSDEMHSFYLKLAVLDIHSPSSFSNIMDILKTVVGNSFEWPNDLKDLNNVDADEICFAIKDMILLKEVTLKKIIEINKVSSQGILLVVMISELLPGTLSNDILTYISVKLEQENKELEETYSKPLIEFFSSEYFVSQFKSDLDRKKIPKPSFMLRIKFNCEVINLINKIVHDKYLIKVEESKSLLDFDKSQVYSLRAIASRATHKRLKQELDEENLDQGITEPAKTIQKFKKICTLLNKSLAIPDLDLEKRDDNQPSYANALWTKFFRKSHAENL